MNSLQSLSKSSQKNSQNIRRNQNLIEAFKDQGKAATVGVARTAYDQLFGSSKPDQYRKSENWQENQQFQEILYRERTIQQRERILIQQQRQSETLIFNCREETAKKEINLIRQEIKSLVVQTGKLSNELLEAEKAVFGNIPDIKSGKYYLSFFEGIKNLIILAKKKITESQTWLGVFNKRCQNKSYYWTQVAKSGSKYMMSHDRAVATSVG
jgi:hypothetical protein